MSPPRPGGLAVLQLGWGTPWCTSLVGWPVPVSGTGVIVPRSQGGGVLGGLSPHPLCRPLVGRGFPWPCVRGVLSPRQWAGRGPWEGGG